ncbi:MAG: alpha-galactosidase [Leptonema sp. (in: Bacteria)]|nr:alpha-galactosidase [Leptonema sp. (in: bacteria)]
MKTLTEQFTIQSIDLEINSRPSRSIDCNFNLNQDSSQELHWPGANGRIVIQNQRNGYRIKLFLTCERQLEHVSITADLSKSISHVFCNGYNDWTASREFKLNEQWGRTRLILRYLAGAMTDIHFVEPTIRGPKSDKRSHEWTILRNKDQALFIGSLNDFDAFTYFEYTNSSKIIIHRDVNGWLLNNETCIADLWISETGYNNLSELFETFFMLKNLPPLRTKPATGYTSWYYHYNQIVPSQIESVITSFQMNQIPIDFIQIDDGTQKRVGDWLDLKPEFGQSLKPLVEKIHGAGFKAGLWLAPFVAEAKSNLIKNHPDWIAKDEFGRRIKAGFNPLWSYWFYVLDLQNSEVRQYLKNVFQVVLNDWNFDLLKLDFLYAAALQNPKSMTRSQLMTDAVDLIHEATGWKPGQPHSYDKKNGPLLLGCGIPPSAAIGKFDFCRIGSDVKESWEDNLLKFMRYQERVSTYNSLLSTIGRWPYNGRGFWNDPDVFYLRENYRALKPKEKKKKLPMTEVEKTTLLLLNHVIGSLIITSYPVHEYDQETLNR